jgi:cobalt/nickel transport system permease protein
MRLDFLDPSRPVRSPLDRIDDRIKLIAVVCFVVAVVATPIGHWSILAAQAMALIFVVGLSGVSPRELATRWLGFFVLFGFLSVVVAPGRPESARYGWPVVSLGLLAKDSLAFLATVLLVRVTTFRKVLVAIRKLGGPRLLVATLHFMYRYLFVLADELDRMLHARRARTFRHSGRLEWLLLSGLIGRLFLRSFERGERVHDAMLARGWDGTVRTLD